MNPGGGIEHITRKEDVFLDDADEEPPITARLAKMKMGKSICMAEEGSPSVPPRVAYSTNRKIQPENSQINPKGSIRRRLCFVLGESMRRAVRGFWSFGKLGVYSGLYILELE